MEFKDYKVKDVSLAEFGRKEIELAESEMPALIKLRERYGKDKPLQGCKNYGLHTHDYPNCGSYRNVS